MFVWKRPKINEKEAGDGPFLKSANCWIFKNELAISWLRTWSRNGSTRSIFRKLKMVKLFWIRIETTVTNNYYYYIGCVTFDTTFCCSFLHFCGFVKFIQVPFYTVDEDSLFVLMFWSYVHLFELRQYVLFHLETCRIHT